MHLLLGRPRQAAVRLTVIAKHYQDGDPERLLAKFDPHVWQVTARSRGEDLVIELGGEVSMRADAEVAAVASYLAAEATRHCAELLIGLAEPVSVVVGPSQQQALQVEQPTAAEQLTLV